MGSISEVNARKTPGPDGYFHYTWDEVEEVARHDGYNTAWCPVCGDLLICHPSMDALLEGIAQRDNQNHQRNCLDVILGI